MLKIFKSVDEKLADIGFVKIRESRFLCEYERLDEEFDFMQRVSISYKESGRHILQSYDPELFDEKKIGNSCVGLTLYEIELFYKKMKQMFKKGGIRQWI